VEDQRVEKNVDSSHDRAEENPKIPQFDTAKLVKFDEDLDLAYQRLDQTEEDIEKLRKEQQTFDKSLSQNAARIAEVSAHSAEQRELLGSRLVRVEAEQLVLRNRSENADSHLQKFRQGNDELHRKIRAENKSLVERFETRCRELEEKLASLERLECSLQLRKKALDIELAKMDQKSSDLSRVQSASADDEKKTQDSLDQNRSENDSA
jgi:chromosome segregation ATPase